MRNPARRAFLETLGSLAGLAMVDPVAASGPLHRAIPATGESIPALGMGTWITFDVGGDSSAIDQRVEVLRAFFALGGRMIDSSPMYGSAADVVGTALRRLAEPPVFAASKIWIPGRERGVAQLAHQRGRWGVERFDLVQVHNMVDWRTHLETLLVMKDEGRLRYAGVTTSHGRRHEALAEVIRMQPVDFVQLSYSIADREAEAHLLPLAREHGKAVIINRPFRTGALIRAVAGRPLPGIAEALDCRSWAEFLLKFVISHPAVTCAIPATSRVDHMRENMRALHGPMPDSAARAAMVRAFESA